MVARGAAARDGRRPWTEGRHGSRAWDGRRRSGGGSQAKRPRPSLLRRVANRLPSRGRLGAFLLALTLASTLLYLGKGPHLRVRDVDWSGTRFTSAAAVEEALAGVHGRSVLALDTSVVASRLRTLPSVADAQVQVALPGRVQVTIREKQPALVWRTSAGRLLAAADGTLIAAFTAEEQIPADIAALPSVEDLRAASSALAPGDRVDPDAVPTALRLATLDPTVVGSSAAALSLRFDEQYGFVLASPRPGWEAALGYYGMEPDDGPAIAERIERQLAAIRTLFATQPEATVRWLDARNPGKVYFRASEG